MLRYVLIKLVQSVIALIGVSIIVFSFARLSGGPPLLTVLCDGPGCDDYNQGIVDKWNLDRNRLGFNDPWYIHYFIFVQNASRGEFGPALGQDRTAMELVLQVLPGSLQLAAVPMGATLLLAVPIGVMSAVKKGAVLDIFGRQLVMLGYSMPPFLLGIVLIWIFDPEFLAIPANRGGALHWVLASSALSLFLVAAVIRLTRTSMLDALDSNYIKMARIKGIPEWKVVWKHGLANAAIPVLAAFPILATLYMFNVVAIEWVFLWQGAGLLAYAKMGAPHTYPDWQVFQAITMLIAVLFIGINLLIDVLCAYIDPRIRQA